jgi:hypothetical protein
LGKLLWPLPDGIAVLASFYKKHHKDSSDFEILAVSIDDDRAAAQFFANTASQYSSLLSVRWQFPRPLYLAHACDFRQKTSGARR